MTYALEINQLVKMYDNGVHAVKGIDLQVEKGDFFALLGPNGAGKSTTIGIVSSLVRKTSGRVKILGYDLDKETYQAKCNIGVVPQEFNFNQFSKTQDILVQQGGYYGLTRHESKKQAEKYLEQLGLSDKSQVVSRELSGGMKRRLMIARALMHEPKLLILDEPTAGVDIELRRSMWDFLRYINDQLQITIILTTHYLEEAEQLCRNIAIIDQGSIVECSSMSQLLSQLSHETFVLYCDKPLPDSIAVPNYTICREDAQSLQVTVDKQQGLSDLIVQLKNLGIEVVSMRNHTNRLEELFVQRTGAQSSVGVS